jgi:hypothetical protein
MFLSLHVLNLPDLTKADLRPPTTDRDEILYDIWGATRAAAACSQSVKMAAAVVVDLPECPHEMIEPSKLAPSTPEAASYSAPHVDGSDSELSDIEDGEEEKKDIGQIVPDRYEGGVPIFTPTMDQFKDFMQYVSLCPQLSIVQH